MTTLRPATLSAIIALLLSAACSQDSNVARAGATAASSTAQAARDIGSAAGLAARETVSATSEATTSALQQAEILSMPKMQEGWIEPSRATEAARDSLQYWDPLQVREWRVRLKSGKIYSIHQAMPRLSVGDQVLVIRYTNKLAISH